MAHPFLDRLTRGPLLADGAMGTLLYGRGAGLDQPFDALNLTARDAVQSVHLDYIRAGAELVETNTFGANRLRLAASGLADRAREINRNGARIAKEARDIAGQPVFLAGSIGPVGKPLAPFGLVDPGEASDAFREQAEALLEGGVDLLVLETFSDLDEILLALRAVRSTGLPVVASMTFTEEGKTVRGLAPSEIVAALQDAGAEVIGANCSVGSLPMLDVVQQMVAASARPVSAMPNAGFPSRVGGRYLYVSSPAYMAEHARRMVELGAAVVGGCCGTTPQHIAAMREALRDLRPAAARPAAAISAAPGREMSEASPAEAPTRLAHLLGRRFVISVEIDPPKGLDPSKDLEGARMVRDAGADVINVGDSPMARVRMGALAMAHLIQSGIGAETILHFTTRDRNVMGLQADLVGAHALGVRNILALSGDPPRVGDYPHVTAVYDVDSVGLIRILSHLRAGKDLGGGSIGRPARFHVGCALDLNPQVWDREIPRFEQKLDAGADFAMTQFVFEPEPILEFLRRFGRPSAPIVLGIMPLQSYRQAEFLHNEVPGIVIAQWIRDRLREAGSDARDVGLRIAEELLDAVVGLVDGVYLMPSFGRYEVVTHLVQRIRAHPALQAARPAR